MNNDTRNDGVTPEMMVKHVSLSNLIRVMASAMHTQMFHSLVINAKRDDTEAGKCLAAVLDVTKAKAEEEMAKLDAPTTWRSLKSLPIRSVTPMISSTSSTGTVI